MPNWMGHELGKVQVDMRLSSGALPLLDSVGFFRLGQRLCDGLHGGAGLNGRRAGHIGDECFPVRRGVAQVRVCFKKGSVSHVLILS